MYLYLGVRHFFAIICLSNVKGDAMKQYHGRYISIRCQNGWENYLESSDVIYQADGIGLILQ